MSEWRLTQVVAKWFAEQEWEERPEIDEEKKSSSTNFGYKLGDFSVKCWLDVEENGQYFKIFIYFFDTKVPEAKVPEVLKWINLVNNFYRIGTMYLKTDTRVICFYHGNDYENASFETQHISNTVNYLTSALEYRLPQFMAICFGGKTAEEAWEISPED